MTSDELLSYLRDAAQGASNSAASNVSGPVDLLAWLLRKGGVPVPENALGGSQWMAERGLTAKPKNALAGLAGETLGMVGPIVAAAKAPQIANALLKAGENAAARPMLNPQTGAIVWHGSPHKFDKFDASKIGTGEGAQAYGHGLYLADHPETAMSYQPRDPKFEQRIMSAYKQAEARGQYPAMEVHEAYLLHKTPAEVQAMIDGMEGVSAADKAAAMQAHKFAQQQYAKQTTGALYKVDLPDEHIARMLDWDKPLSQQAPVVQKILETEAAKLAAHKSASARASFNAKLAAKGLPARFTDSGAPVDVSGWTGQQFHSAIENMLGGRVGVSEYLKAQGIPGIRYLDGGSRGAGAGTSNYVVFPGNENLLRILERNGVPIGQ